MALFKPKKTEGSFDSSKFYGVCPMGIVGYQDRADNYDWADILLDAEVQLKDSDYTKKLTIKGTFERGDDGKIVGGSVLNRLYKFFESIGCTAGVNVEGKWETDDGKEIKDISQYLSDNHLSSVIPGTLVRYDYVGYVYREQNKTNKQIYTRVYHRLWPNDDKGIAELTSHIAWMRERGFLKEYVENTANGTTKLQGEGVLNL